MASELDTPVPFADRALSLPVPRRRCRGPSVQMPSMMCVMVTGREPNEEPLEDSAEGATETLHRWERRIRREVNSPAYEDVGAFFDHWEQPVLVDGWVLGKARLKVLREMHDLSSADLEFTLTYLNAYLLTVTWFSRRAANLRAGRRGGSACDVLTETLEQALGVAAEIACLVENGHPVGARARWRTLYELAVCAEFVHKHGERAAQRYKAGHIVQAFHDLEPMAGLLTEKKQLSDWKKLQRRYRELDARYGPFGTNPGAYWWAAPFLTRKSGRVGLNQLARDVGESLEEYCSHYNLANHHVHADRRSSVLSLRKSGTREFRPAPGDFIDPVRATVDCLDLMVRRLAARTLRATSDRRVVYWSHLTYMISLDVKTESRRDGVEVDPGYLSRALGLG